MEAFVYCWTDHKTNKLYVGSHKGKEDDNYVCSSKLMLEEYNKRSEDFTRQIIARGSFSDIRILEAKILDSLNVKEDRQFYNMHNGNGNFYLKGHTEEYKKRMSVLLTGKKKRTTANYKKPKSESHKRKLSESKTGKKLKPFSIQHRKNMSAARKNFFANNLNPRIGLHLEEKTKNLIQEKLSKSWLIITPKNEQLIIKNLTKFCRDNNLQQSCMGRVSSGERKSHRGYKVFKLE